METHSRSVNLNFHRLSVCDNANEMLAGQSLTLTPLTTWQFIISHDLVQLNLSIRLYKRVCSLSCHHEHLRWLWWLWSVNVPAGVKRTAVYSDAKMMFDIIMRIGSVRTLLLWWTDCGSVDHDRNITEAQDLCSSRGTSGGWNVCASFHLRVSSGFVCVCADCIFTPRWRWCINESLN